MSWSDNLERIGRLAHTVGKAEVIIGELAAFIRHLPTDPAFRRTRGEALLARADAFLHEISSPFCLLPPSAAERHEADAHTDSAPVG